MRFFERHLLSVDDFPRESSHQGLVRAVSAAMQRPFALRSLAPTRPLDYRMEVLMLGATMVARLRTSPIEVELGASAAETDNIVIEMSTGDAPFVARQGQQEVVAERGAALISMGALPRQNRAEHGAALLILQLPLQNFLHLLDAVAQRPLRVIPSETPGLMTLRSYLLSLLDGPDQTDAQMTRLLAGQLNELCLALARTAWPFSVLPDAPASRRRWVKHHVMQHLTSPDLCEASAAKALGVSGSYLRKLFVTEGGFARYVRQQRLEQAHRLLRDPAFATMTVIEIAGTCGFSDLSAFNRQFRRHFNAVPSSLRRPVPAVPPSHGPASFLHRA